MPANDADLNQSKQNTPAADQITYLVPAGFWWRFSAFLIDCYIVSLIALLLIVLVPEVSVISNKLIQSLIPVLGTGVLASSHLVITALLIILISLIYFPIFEGSFWHSTPGKFVMGLSVWSSKGTTISYSAAILRSFGRIICYLTGGIGYLVVGFTPSNQGLHDLIADSIVVKDPNITNAQRSIGLLCATCFSIAATLLMPDTEQLIKETEVLPPKSVTIQTTKKKQEPTFPDNDLGYLEFGQTKLSFTALFTQISKQSTEKDPLLSDQFKEYYWVVNFAFFKDQLSKEDSDKLKYASNFFDDSERLIKKQASVVLTLSFPNYLEICPFDRIEKGLIQINPHIVPHKDLLKASNLKTEIDAQELYGQGNFFSECTSLEPGGKFSLALKTDLKINSNTPTIRINIRSSSEMMAYKSAGVRRYTSARDSVALWQPSKKTLTIGFFNRPLTMDEKTSLFSARSIDDLENLQPEAVIAYSHPANLKRFVRDQVSKYSIKFYRQESGPLAFNDNLESLSIDSNDIPAALAGKIRQGDQVVGRIEGQKELLSSAGNFNFYFSVPFNALLIILTE